MCELWAGAISYDEPMDDDDDSAREDADSARSDAESLGKLCTSVTVMLQKIFLGNVPDAKGKICTLFADFGGVIAEWLERWLLMFWLLRMNFWR